MPSGWTRRAGRRMADPQAPLLSVRGLSIGYRDGLGRLSLAVQDLSLT